MEGRCERHLFDQAIDLCGRCGQEFCADCLVYSFGAQKPPFCLRCAVEAAGVRQGGNSRVLGGRREQKALARRREEFLAGREEREAKRSHYVAMDDSWLDRVDQG